MAKPVPQVAILTGGDDKSYAVGLTTSLTATGICVDYIGSDRVDSPELHKTTSVNFLNLRGDQNNDASFGVKIRRIVLYYFRLLKYAASAKPRIFHILWNNKFEFIDRVLLMLYYRTLGKRVVLTVHNVNAAKRDGCDSACNRFTLRIQYRLMDHLFVHTQKMKAELIEEFSVPEHKVSVIPFGLNDTTPVTDLNNVEARQTLRLLPQQKVALFFGQIAPYKGLEYLVAALPELMLQHPDFRLVIAGKVKKGCEDYWNRIQRGLNDVVLCNRVITRIEHIPENQVELFFKAADVLVIPYVDIFQSGVPFLAYNFGLPVIATDVGSLKEDIVEGRTGFVCQPRNPADLARAIGAYFKSDLYRQLEFRRRDIRNLAEERHSWAKVAAITRGVYSDVGTSRAK